jgi:hypothetical protein
MTPEEPVRVTVAVPTYRRPADLGSLLPLVLWQAADVSATSGGRYLVDVLVVDNDPDRSGEAVAGGFPGETVRYVAEPEPGIAAVRNRALAEAAGSRLLASIDDDERPAAGWLTHLLETWRTTGAAAVSGRIVADYEGALDPYIEAGGFFSRPSMVTGTEVGTAATGNLLLDLEQVRGLGVRFDPDLGLSGGEDNLFSRALVAGGGRIVWCDEAVAVDKVPAARMTRRWVLMRQWSHGNAAVLTDVRLARGAADVLRVRVRALAGGSVRVLAGAGRWSAGAVTGSQRHRARGLRTLLRGVGMLSGAAGLAYHEYARAGERRWRVDRFRRPAELPAGSARIPA